MNLALAPVVVLSTLVMASAGAASVSRSATHLGPAEACAGAITVTDPRHDTRSWVMPPRLPEAEPLYGDLRRFEVKATTAGVCVRWTTAAPALPGATLVFTAWGPFVRVGGGAQAAAYGINLVLHRDGAVATYGRDRLNSDALRVVRVRAGRTGSVVSAFIPAAELNRPPANQPTRPRFSYRAFTFQARVLTAADARGNQRVDFWPQEGGIQKVAADINGHLCFPCHDPRFTP